MPVFMVAVLATVETPGALFMVHLQHGWNSVNMGSGDMGRGMECQFKFSLLMIAVFLFVGNARAGADEA